MKRWDKTSQIAKALNRLTDYLATAESHATEIQKQTVNGESNKTLPPYSPKNGLSPELIEKYGLSSREAEATDALLRGKSDKEIAALLDISLNTVQTHLKHVYRKTGTRGRFALMALVGVGNRANEE
jgi:DNA-binding CsgD family transcriptional regulator